MSELIGEAAMYEQLAEECTELAHAALKKARLIRGENPTPMTEDRIDDQVTEEVTDVQICLHALGLEADPDLKYQKICRFYRRWRMAHDKDSD